jgi:small subunit ribosomal protein S16
VAACRSNVFAWLGARLRDKQVTSDKTGLTPITKRVSSSGGKKSMAVKIRLARGGAKKKPFYQVVVADERYPRDGRFIEKLGQYDPKQDPPVFNVVEERTLEWLNKGAQPTDTVRQLLRKQGIWAKFKQA